MRHRHPVTIDRVVVRSDAPRGPQGRIQVTHELVAEQVEINPLRRAAPFGTSEDRLVEVSRLVDVAHLHSDVKWRETHDQFSVARRPGDNICAFSPKSAMWDGIDSPRASAAQASPIAGEV